MMISRADIFDKIVGPQGKFSRFEAWFFLLSQAEIEEPNAGLIKFGHRDLMKVFGWSRRAVVTFLEELQQAGKLKINDPLNDPLNDPAGTTYLITNFTSYSGVIGQRDPQNDPQNDPLPDFVLNYPNKDLNNSPKKDPRLNLDLSKEREGGMGGENSDPVASATLAPSGAHVVSKQKSKKQVSFVSIDQVPDPEKYPPGWLEAFQQWLTFKAQVKRKPYKTQLCIAVAFERLPTTEMVLAAVKHSTAEEFQGLYLPSGWKSSQPEPKKETWLDKAIKAALAEEQAAEAEAARLKAAGGARHVDLRVVNGKGRGY